MDAVHKAILSYYVDKRDDLSTRRFVTDLRARVLGRPQISSDGWQSYVSAIEDAFGADADYRMRIKDYKSDSGEGLDAVEIITIAGNPDPRLISTSYIERQNLTSPDARSPLHAAHQRVLQEAGNTARRSTCTSPTTTCAASTRRCASRRPCRSA